MINLNSERIKFEETMRKNSFPEHHLRKDKRGNYLRKNAQSAFQGWVLKASATNRADKNTFLLNRILFNLKSVNDLKESEHQALVNRVNGVIGLVEHEMINLLK